MNCLHTNICILYVDMTILAALEGQLEKQRLELNRALLEIDGTLENSSLSKSLVVPIRKGELAVGKK